MSNYTMTGTAGDARRGTRRSEARPSKMKATMDTQTKSVRPEIRHGTRSGYVKGVAGGKPCRCDSCRGANNAYFRARKAAARREAAR